MIQGYSGCTIKFENDRAVKSSTHYSAKRLVDQAQKQKSFEQHSYTDISIPRVLKEYYVGANYCFEMEYFNAIDMIQFLNTYNIDSINLFLNIISSFIQQNLAKSLWCNIPRATILDKYDALRLDGQFDSVFYTMPRTVYLPIGPCHGDLTLSNILYSRGKFVLIDFLDSFLESPLLDIAKLRQDTHSYWSLLLYTQPYNEFRLRSILDYLDRKITAIFQHDILRMLEILNLLRIIPYCKDYEMKQEVRRMLCQL